MTLPPPKAWLFSSMNFAAAALALYVAFSLNLSRPFWAVTTVYITTQPFAGATRAKAMWRLIGTFAGGAFTVAVLPNLVNAPLLLCLAFAFWIAVCLSLSLLDPTPRSYAFMLAGYTAAMIGFPSVDAPGTIFDTAVSRCEEIGIGILCAWLVHGALFPRSGVPMLRAKLTAWLADVARFGATALRGELDDAKFSTERRRMARDSAALYALFLPARYELSGNAALLWLPVLREHARRVPALITFIADRASALHKEDPEAYTVMQPLLEDTAQWLSDTALPAEAETTDLAARRLLERIHLAGEAARAHPTWSGVLHEGIAARLIELVESWQECVSLGARMLAVKSTEMPPPAETVSTPGHTDPLLIAMSGVSTALGILVGCAFWIATGWAGGSAVPMMAAIMACLFAQLDDPAPAIMKFLLGVVLTVVIAEVLLFAVLPSIDGFPLLLLALALAYLPAGAFQTVPASAAAAMAITTSLPTIMGLQETYQADFAVFADGSASVLLGMILSLVVTRLVRSVGVAWRVRRLQEADRRDLLHLIEGQSHELRHILAVMLDRFEALAARLGATDARTIGTAELTDLRASLNVLRLREQTTSLTPGLRQLITDALGALGAELRGRGSAAITLARIDTALVDAMAEPDEPTRNAALSIAGLRLARFPDAPPPPLTQDNAIRSLAV